jgi:monovalent cation:H+ antiporter, CPA1 family
MAPFLQTETLIIVLLIVVALVAALVRRLRIPYIVSLVIVGLILTVQSPIHAELTPELILTLFVPPLVFEAAYHLNYQELRNNLTSILIFAVPGVILTTLIVGGVLAWTIRLPLALAMLFGALISATDPLAVVATFRKLGAPHRLTVLLEGESLLNDGTAIVMFNLMLVIAITGKFDLAGSVVDFIRVSVGGTLIGVGLGWVISSLIGKVDDFLIEMTLTTVLAFGSYLVADFFHFSGVLAVVAAGLMVGNLGRRGMSPTTRIVLSNFWEYIAFLANSIVFLLIGMQVNLPSFGDSWRAILGAILAVLIARIVIVYGLSWVTNRLKVEPIPLKWQHVLSWSGLRGAISLALALSLPITLGNERGLLVVMTYGVVLFTLLVQSTSMRGLIHRLHIITRSEAQLEYEKSHARLASLRVADTHLDQLHKNGGLSTPAWEQVKQMIHQQAETLISSVKGLVKADPSLEADELEKGWREAFRSQRSALLSLRQDGVISDEVYQELSAEVDAQLIEGLTGGLLEEGRARTQFVDVKIPSKADAAGKIVAELGLPREAVLVSVRRGGSTFIPRGDTLLLPNDVVTTLCERECIAEVKQILLAPPQSDAEDSVDTPAT